MRKYTYIIILSSIFLLLPSISSAQNSGNCGWTEIEDAKKKFNSGIFYEAIDMLDDCINNFDRKKQIEALSLISKIYFEIENDSLASYYAAKLLDVNPNYQPTYSSDPIKFINIISDIKQRTDQTTITSISKKKENIDETPATALLLSGKQIERRGYLDLEAVIHDLPGFDISRSNGNLYSHIYQRGYRSINTNRTLFLIDGIEENDLWSSNVYLSRQYAMSNIKSIEVIYGPASTMYGSNAFLGAINIITKDPKDFFTENNNIALNTRIGYGSYNTKFADGSLAIKNNTGNIVFSVTGRLFLSDEQDLSDKSEHDFASYTMEEHEDHFRSVLSINGYDNVQNFMIQNPQASDLYTINADSTIITPTNTGIRQAIDADNSVYNSVNYKDKTEAYSINAKLQIYDFILGWSSWNKSEGTGTQYNDLIFLTTGEGGTWNPIHNYMYAKYDKDINSNLNISSFTRFKTHTFGKENNVVLLPARYYLGNFGLPQLLTGVVPEPINYYLFQKSNQLREELKLLYQYRQWLDIVSGFEARFSSVQGDYYSFSSDSAQEQGVAGTNIPGGNQFFSRDLGVYVQAGIRPIDNLQLTLGARFDNNKVRETQGYGNSFNPRLAIVYTPGSYTIKAIYAEAFKDATNKEKYSTAEDKRELANPFLKPEKVKNYEFVIGKHFFNNQLKISSSFYHANYSNIIQEVNVELPDGESTNQNQAIGQAEIQGINAFADYRQGNLNIYANYTYTNPYTLNPLDEEGNPLSDSLGNAYEKLRISDIADHQINVGINYLFFNRLNINLRANYISERITGYNTTVPTNTEYFPAYIITNGAISYTHKKTGLSIQYSVFNILDKEYFSPGLDSASGELASMLYQNKQNHHISLTFKF